MYYNILSHFCGTAIYVSVLGLIAFELNNIKSQFLDTTDSPRRVTIFFFLGVRISMLPCVIII